MYLNSWHGISLYKVKNWLFIQKNSQLKQNQGKIMNILLTILAVFALSFSLVLITPMLTVGLALVSFTGAFLIWLLPSGYV
tara:strand:- start:1116 stop:1358 length:243 start_codon:yes stop_codon:yes gene_type:complete